MFGSHHHHPHGHHCCSLLSSRCLHPPEWHGCPPRREECLRGKGCANDLFTLGILSHIAINNKFKKLGEFNKNIWRGNKAQSDVCMYLLSTLCGGRCSSEEEKHLCMENGLYYKIEQKADSTDLNLIPLDFIAFYICVNTSTFYFIANDHA